MNQEIYNISNEFESIIGNLSTEDDVKIQFHTKVVSPLLKLVNPNLLETFKSEVTLIQGGRADALYQNIAFEYKKTIMF